MAEVYNTDRFAELYYGSQNPPSDNLALAGMYLSKLLNENGIPVAYLGGWAVYLRGGGRSTNDVDMAVRCNMHQLLAVLMPQSRLCIPVVHGAAAIQVFVHTGGWWEPGYGAYAVSVDIIIGGNLGTPPNIPLGTELIVPMPMTPNGFQEVRVLDLQYHFATKLSAFSGRNGLNDYMDLTFLFMIHSDQLIEIWNTFDQQQRRHYCRIFASRNPSILNDPRYMKQVFGMDIAEIMW